MKIGASISTRPQFMIDVYFLRENNRGFCLAIFSNTFSLSCHTAKREFGFYPDHGWWSGVDPAEVERLARLEKAELARAERKTRRLAKSKAD